jgi:hypothetical protein
MCERNKQTCFRDDTVRFDVCDVVKCEANIRAAQRRKIALVAHNALASGCYKCSHRLGAREELCTYDMSEL